MTTETALVNDITIDGVTYRVGDRVLANVPLLTDIVNDIPTEINDAMATIEANILAIDNVYSSIKISDFNTLRIYDVLYDNILEKVNVSDEAIQNETIAPEISYQATNIVSAVNHIFLKASRSQEHNSYVLDDEISKLYRDITIKQQESAKMLELTRWFSNKSGKLDSDGYIFNQALDIIKSGNVESVYRENYKLIAITKEVILKGDTTADKPKVNFGKYKIVIGLNDINVFPKTAKDNTYGYSHPNINMNGEVCFGTYNKKVYSSLGRFEYINVLYYTLDLIFNAVSAGGYFPIESWATDATDRCNNCWELDCGCGVCSRCGENHDNCECLTCPSSGEPMENIPDDYCVSNCNHYDADSETCEY